jgi:hypothetical protein
MEAAAVFMRADALMRLPDHYRRARGVPAVYPPTGPTAAAASRAIGTSSSRPIAHGQSSSDPSGLRSGKSG